MKWLDKGYRKEDERTNICNAIYGSLTLESGWSDSCLQTLIKATVSTPKSNNKKKYCRQVVTLSMTYLSSVGSSELRLEHYTQVAAVMVTVIKKIMTPFIT